MKTGTKYGRMPDEDWVRSVENVPGDMSAEHEQHVERWHKQYTAQDEARERIKAARLKSGGDASLFSVIDAADIDEPEPVSVSKGGLMLSTGVHRVNGSAGYGKTRVVYWEILQRMRAGERWAIFDTEMGPARYKQAMIQLGATDLELESCDYIQPQDDIIPDLVLNGRALCKWLSSRGCSGVLYDSMTPFLAAAGVEENDPQGVRAWTDAACRPLVSTGGTAIIIDHTGHEAPERGRGSSDKSAGCDVDMFIKSVQPFARGVDGQVALTITKDRSGTLATGSQIRIMVRCYENGEMDLEPEEWDATVLGDGSDIAEILAMLLLKLGRDYATAAELQRMIPGQKQRKLEQIDLSVRSGQIIEERDGNSKHYLLPENE